MQPSQPTVRDLFESRIVYRIPNYQRAYVWNERDQWEPLWMDVEAVAIRLLTMEENDWPMLNPHFLGAVVLKQLTRPAGQPNTYTVVDGQQRMTTIQLLLAAAADAYRQKGFLDIESLLRDLMVNSARGREDSQAPFKINPIGRDFTSFTEVMQCSKDAVAPNQVKDSMGQCYRFFFQCMGIWLDESANDIDRRANALFTVLQDKLQVVEILLNAGENEYAIFEALNARGEPLSEWEKIKNYILYRAGETRGLDQDELYKEYLEGFDEPEWRVETGSGAARRRKSDLFLDYWLESNVTESINARHVFREFRDRMGSFDLKNTCVDLKQRGIYFLRWNDAEEMNGDVHAIFHYRRNVLRMGAVWPFLIALSRIDMDNADRNRCLRALDSYMWRRAIVGLDARGYDAQTMALLESLSQNPSDSPHSNAVIEELLDSGGQRRFLWPSDQEVKQYITDTPVYLYKSQRIVQALLESVERALMRKSRPGNVTLASNLPIEHIMPQRRNSADWPLPSGADPDFESRRDVRIHYLGNLTLVERGLNSVLSNRSWVDKRQILNNQDNLYINKDLLTHAPAGHWDEEQIQLRSERLADYIIKIWPHGHAVTGDIEKV